MVIYIIISEDNDIWHAYLGKIDSIIFIVAMQILTIGNPPQISDIKRPLLSCKWQHKDEQYQSRVMGCSDISNTSSRC